ncbi:MAG: GDSL-type esterase/lipase family protein [Ruminococcus sp.]|nr:GDSL-type esterase/lipase family protein [Ruminococcus sp.]
MGRVSFPADEEHVRTGGRTFWEKGLRYIDYTCSFIEFEFEGTYAEAEIISDLTPSEDIFRGWLAVFVNDEESPSQRFKVDEKEGTYVLYKSDRAEKVTIRIMKLSEAAFAKIAVREITVEGTLLPPPKPKSRRRIEFVGDSITCGYGIEGKWNVDTFSTATENPLKGYAYKTAKKCSAEYQYVSWSGMGVISCYVDETAEKPLDGWLMRDIYPYNDSGLENTLGREGHENHTPWDFSKYSPQVVVFNDGTNDHSWTKDIPQRREDFKAAYYEILEMIRRGNPESYIVCTYGVMGDELAEEETALVERFKSEHDERICFVRLPVQPESDGIGADWHPSEVTHEKVSVILAERINEIFGEMGL